MTVVWYKCVKMKFVQYALIRLSNSSTYGCKLFSAIDCKLYPLVTLDAIGIAPLASLVLSSL